MYFLYILFAILIFSFLIATHELGHFLTAKLFGVKVNEFSLFMGPAIWKRQKGETLYAIRSIPIGGYCAMEGEDGDSTDPRSFYFAKWWQKVIILAAGAAMNFLSGLLLTLLLVGCTASAVSQPVIDYFDAGSAVEGPQGLQVGDRILEIDGERVYTANDVSILLSLSLNGGGDVHDLVVLRDGREVPLNNFAMELREFPDEDGSSRLRYGINLRVEPANLGNVLSYSWNTTVDYVRTVRLSLQMLFRGQASINDMGGPVLIVKTIADVGTQADSASIGISNVLSYAALIAVNLAVMNLLPIPALDGGRIVGVLLTSAIEGVTKKKLNPKIEGYIHAGGMVVLLLFMGFILFKDVFQIVH